MAGRINRSILKNEISKTKAKSLEKEASIIANKILEDQKREYLNNINNHPVSQELMAGPDSENISRTLDGEGNLYTFIGFNQGEKPIEDLTDLIDKNTRIEKGEFKDGVFNFRVSSPSLEELQTFTPMPFEGGNSWLKSIEKGISGFSNYLYGLMFASSRSGRGIQSQNKVRKASYKPVKYFSLLYKDFIQSFR